MINLLQVERLPYYHHGSAVEVGGHQKIDLQRTNLCCLFLWTLRHIYRKLSLSNNKNPQEFKLLKIIPLMHQPAVASMFAAGFALIRAKDQDFGSTEGLFMFMLILGLGL